MKIKIFYEDTDATGVVYHANYLKFCDRARSKYFFDSDTPIETLDGHLIIHSLQCKYLSPSKIGDELNIKSIIVSLKKTSMELEQNIFLNNKPIFSMNIKMLYVIDGKPSIFHPTMISLFNSILKAQ